MCETTNSPDENNKTNNSMEATDENSIEIDAGDIYEDEEIDDDDDDEDDDDLSIEEFQAIDSKLDEINTALDTMENQRDKIHEQLIELLRSSREIRKELQEEQVMNTDP